MMTYECQDDSPENHSFIRNIYVNKYIYLLCTYSIRRLIYYVIFIFRIIYTYFRIKYFIILYRF